MTPEREQEIRDHAQHLARKCVYVGRCNSSRCGRPALPAEERQRHRLTVRLTDGERAEVEAYAAREGVGLAEAVRCAVLLAARTRVVRPRRRKAAL